MAAEIPHLYSSMMFNGVPNKMDCPVQLATFDIVGLAAGIIFDNVNLGFLNPKLFVFYFGEVLFSGLRWSYNVVPSFKLVKIAIVFGLSTMNHSCSSYWHQLSLGTGAPPGNREARLGLSGVSTDAGHPLPPQRVARRRSVNQYTGARGPQTKP